MRLRILQGAPEGALLCGEPWPAEGDEIDLPTAQAAHLVASGVAEEVTAKRTRKARRGGDDE
ncbi:hypothetical protein [Streptomyces cylindrosporus]|uniref:Uncharacterized protein n=1 Tax=Streptomyces cylindrosporus TaxID=2927583 RepID=A0ABS9Y895_9ACTN|nr:hypothetical protein [Streptomyces cylindrosporus]MCI3272146.1 hypothetical protein [Streptomyces cylindrosporus]